MTTISEYADRIMAGVEQDRRNGIIPANVSAWRHLGWYNLGDGHDYLLQACWDDQQPYWPVLEGMLDERIKAGQTVVTVAFDSPDWEGTMLFDIPADKYRDGLTYQEAERLDPNVNGFFGGRILPAARCLLCGGFAVAPAGQDVECGVPVIEVSAGWPEQPAGPYSPRGVARWMHAERCVQPVAAPQLDTWTIEQDGITYRVEVRPDLEADPAGDPSLDYTPEQVAAWRSGKWRFVTVAVCATDVGGFGDLAWNGAGGNPYGELPADDPDDPPIDTTDRDYLAEGTVKALIKDVRHDLRQLRATLIRLGLRWAD